MDQFELEAVSLVKEETTILNKISVSVPQGAVFTLLGPSGAGKSTLLSLLNRLQEPSSGIIKFKGLYLREFEVTTLRRQVGLVFQEPRLFPGTVAENITYGPRLQGKADFDPAPFLELVALPGTFLTRQGDSLSGGQQQRVAIARALANQPEVLLLDEPTSALNDAAAGQIEQLLLELNSRRHLTLIWVTHSLRQAKRVSSHAALLAEGDLVETAAAATFFSNPREEKTKLFLEGS